MNRPGLGTRFAASPVGALVLFTLYGAVGYGWWWGWEGQHVRWWVALCAAAAFVRTCKAIGRVRRYKAWRAEFDAMAEDPAADPRDRKKPRRRGWLVTAGAVALFVMIPVYLPQVRSSWAVPYRDELVTALTLLWCLAGSILAWKLLRLCWRMVRRSAARGAERRQVEAKNAPVAWLVSVPSFSPSRAEAERNLPEYCARLLAQQEVEDIEHVS